MSHILYGVICLNKRLIFVLPQNDKSHFIGLLLCGAMFLCGSIIGTFSAGLVRDGSSLNAVLTGYLSAYLNGASLKPDLFAAVVDACKYHLAALFLGLSVLGVVFIPVLSAVRGFMLSYSVSAVVRLLGGKGVWLALSVFGLRTIITIPCFFILSIYAYAASTYIFRQSLSKNMKISASPFNSRTMIVCGVCLLILLASALIDTYLSPHLIGLAASHI
jgi:stage II sporulation protein M